VRTWQSALFPAALELRLLGAAHAWLAAAALEHPAGDSRQLSISIGLIVTAQHGATLQIRSPSRREGSRTARCGR
jgi:hypothetical protein